MISTVFRNFRVISSVALVVASPWAVGMEVLLEPELRVTAQHDDNINLSPDNEVSLYGEVINPKAKVTMRSETWTSQLNADLRFSDFNRDGYGSDDQYLTFSGNKQGERYQFGLQLGMTRDTTRTSEELDSGRFSNERREQYSITPTWSYSISTRNLLKLQASASTANYADSRYASYDYGLMFAEWTYVFNEQLSLFLRANASKYKSDGLTGNYRFDGVLTVEIFPGVPAQVPVSKVVEQTYFTDTETSGFQVGASYQWTEKLSLFGLFGNSDTDTDYKVITLNDRCNSTNPQWIPGRRGYCDLMDGNSSTENIETNVTWEEERHTFSLGYSIATQPSSSGYLLEFERADLKWRYQLFERGSASLTTTWGKNEALDQPVGQTANRVDREFVTTTAAYQHRLTENWYISASVRYRYQERGIDSDEAEGFGGTIGISYFFDKKQW